MSTPSLSVVSSSDQGAPDPFNLAALRLPPSFEQDAGVRTQLTTVPIRKPHREEWVRVHPDSEYRDKFAMIHLKTGREFYLVNPSLRDTLRDELTFVTIYTVINKAGVVYLWPCRDPIEGHRRGDAWALSAHAAAEAAMKRLVRIKANMELGAYEFAYTESPIPDADPVWPDKTLFELIQIGFVKTGMYVADLNHPVIKELRGF
jgi:hypothetical protein